jgi:hypothetical protein
MDGKQCRAWVKIASHIMKQQAIKDLRTFLTFLEEKEMAMGTWGFRGVQSSNHNLIPSGEEKVLERIMILISNEPYLLDFAKWQFPSFDPCLRTT